MSVDRAIISAAVLGRNSVYRRLLAEGINESLFDSEYAKQWKWICGQYKEHGQVPDKHLFRDRWGQEYKFERVEPNQLASHIDYIQKRHKYGQLVDTMENTAKRGVTVDSIEEEIDRLISDLTEIRFSTNGRTDRGSPYELVKGSEVRMKQLSWLWQDRMPKGYLTLVAGDGGVGKGLFLADLVARITTGRQLPGELRKRKPGNVLWVGKEDLLEDAVKPRIVAAGGDMERWQSIAAGPDQGFTLPSSLPRLRATLRRERFDLVVIDSVTGYLDHGLKGNQDQDVRKALEPVAPLMAECSSTAVATIHVNKGDQAAAHRILGSVAWRNVARGMLVAGVLPDEEQDSSAPEGRKFGLGADKNNYGPLAKTLGYHVEEATAVDRYQRNGKRYKKTVTTARLIWDDVLDQVQASDLLPHKRTRAGKKTAEKLDQAKVFLMMELASGRQSSEEVSQKAKKENLCSKRTLMTAKRELKVRSVKDGDHWYWELPD